MQGQGGRKLPISSNQLSSGKHPSQASFAGDGLLRSPQNTCGPTWEGPVFPFSLTSPKGLEKCLYPGADGLVVKAELMPITITWLAGTLSCLSLARLQVHLFCPAPNCS